MVEPITEDFRERGPSERDRLISERIEQIRKKQLRREKLTYREWEIIQMASQSCHCGKGTVVG